MIKRFRHERIALAIAIAAILSSCAEPGGGLTRSDLDEGDVEDIARRVAEGVVEDSDQIAQLERKIAELEADLQDQEMKVMALEAESRSRTFGGY